MNNYDWLNCSAIAVVGERGSGKGALAGSLLDQITNRPIFVYSNPMPHLVTARGWKNMNRLEQMYEVQDCVVWLDEPQLTIPRADKKANEGLQKLLSIARHRDITLMFSTCDTRWVTRALESYISAWLVKDIETRLCKQGSMVSKIVKGHVLIDVDEFKLEPHQYLFYSRNYPDLDGLHSFTKPAWFDDVWSKPYALPKLQVAGKVSA